MADEVGSGQVAIKPSFTGFRGDVSREVETSGREGGRKFTSAFKGAVVGLGAALGLGKLKDTFVGSIQSAGQLEQSVGGVQAVFKGSSKQMETFAAQAKTSLGLTKNEYNELGTIIGAQLKNGGVAMDQLAPKTNKLIGLGGDLSAQFGGSAKEAVEALSSALKGERDPIERYGVSLNQAKIDAEAAALGFKKVDGVLSAEASQAATMSLIMKQTADAHGAAAREAGTFASRQSTFNAIMKEGKASIAGAFLPAATALYGFMNAKLPGAFDTATARSTAFANGMTTFFGRIAAFQAGIASGALTPNLVKALGLDPSNGFGKYVGEAIGGIRAFNGAFEAADGDITSSGFAGFMESFGYRTRLAFDGIREAAGPAFAALKSGDFSGLSGVWESFLAIARPAGPIFVEVGKAVGGLSTEIGKMIASAVPLIGPVLQGAAGVMQFLADNTGILTAAVIALAAGMVVWRLAQIAGNIAALASVPVAAAQAASNFALASAIRGQTAAQATNTVAARASLGSRIASTAATIGNTVATVASRAAQIAGAAATGIATAAQWAWNAALSANPIALVVLAIAALVAGLVWFFTQTELGRAIFQSVFQFIQDTVSNVVNWFTGTLVPAFQGAWANIQAGLGVLGNFFSTIFNNIMSFLGGVWNNIVSAIQGFVGTALGLFFKFHPLGILSANFGAVMSFFGTVWSNIISGVSGMVGNVTGFFRDLPGKAVAALSGFAGQMLTVGQNVVQGLIDGARGMVDKAVQAVKDVGGSMLKGIQDFLGIKSPSREFMKIGGWVTLGLAKGVQQKTSVAVKAITGVAAKLRDEAAKRLAPKNLAAVSRAHGAAGVRQVKAEAAALSRSAAAVSAQLGQLTSLAKRREGLVARLKASQKQLSDAITVRNKQATESADTLSGEFKLSDLVGRSASTIRLVATGVASRLKAFAGKMATLRKMGLHPALIAEIGALGSQDGSAVADALIRGGKGEVSGLNAAYKSIGSYAKGAGAAIADGMYGAGIDGLKGLVNGFAGNIRSIDQAAKKVTDRLTSQVKKNLGIRSPSRVFRFQVGQMAGEGLALGIEDMLPRIKAASEVAAAIPAAVSARPVTGTSAVAGTSVAGTAAGEGGTQFVFNGPVFGDPEAYAKKIETQWRRASSLNNLRKVAIG